MKKICSPLSLSIRWMGLFGMLCLWASCSSPKLAQHASPVNHQLTTEAETPQAAQTRPEATDLTWATEDIGLVASNGPSMLPAAAEKLDISLNQVAVENPKLARKVSKLMQKAEKQAAATSGNLVQAANTKDQHAAQKLLAKAEKKMDIMKAKNAEAAQANTTLVALGALLAVVGLVLVLATSGTTATVGLIALALGVVLLIISLLTN